MTARLGRRIANRAQHFGRKVNNTANKFGKKVADTTNKVADTANKVENVVDKVNRNVQRAVPILQDAAITGGTLVTGNPAVGLALAEGIGEVGRLSNKTNRATHRANSRLQRGKVQFEDNVQQFKQRNNLER